jgi:hypothetical protein
MWRILQPTREKVNRVRTIRFLEGTAVGRIDRDPAFRVNKNEVARLIDVLADDGIDLVSDGL